MSRGVKVLLIAGGFLFALAFNATLLAGIAVYRVARHGTAVVRVQERDGARLTVPVPVGLVNLALHLGPRGHVALDPEARRWLPVARAALAEIERCPDAVLVEVRSADEHVVIAKRHGELVVEVRSPDADVDVSVPPGAMGEILDTLVEQAGSSRHI